MHYEINCHLSTYEDFKKTKSLSMLTTQSVLYSVQVFSQTIYKLSYNSYTIQTS